MKRSDFYKLAAEIADWHISTFPDADESGQEAKYDEEYQEFVESHGDIMELADCFIVASALACRFGSIFGLLMINRIINNIADADGELYEAIEKKMEINRERTRRGVWKKRGNSWHHEGDDK